MERMASMKWYWELRVWMVRFNFFCQFWELGPGADCSVYSCVSLGVWPRVTLGYTEQPAQGSQKSLIYPALSYSLEVPLSTVFVRKESKQQSSNIPSFLF